MSTKILEKASRELALQKCLLTEDSGNKGLKLMKKMGYKTGEVLGRRNGVETVNKASIEPIHVEIKLDRGGLGQMEEKKRKYEEIEQMRRSMLENKIQKGKQSEKAYIESKRNKFLLRKLFSDLKKFQKACYQLDTSVKGLREPSVKWFWPINIRRSLKILKTKEQTIEAAPVLEDTQQAELFIAPTSSTSHNYYEKIINADVKRPNRDLKDLYDERLKAFIGDTGDEEKLHEVYEEEMDSEDEQAVNDRFSSKTRQEKNESSDSDDEEVDEDETIYNEEVFDCSY